MKFVGQLLSQHLKRYPRMELSDIYKLLHQATLGPGHAAKDRETALALLEGEAVNLGEGRLTRWPTPYRRTPVW